MVVVVGRYGIITGSQLLILIGQILSLCTCVCVCLFLCSMCSELFYFFFSTSNWGGWVEMEGKRIYSVIILFILDCWLFSFRLFTFRWRFGRPKRHQVLVYITHTHTHIYILNIYRHTHTHRVQPYIMGESRCVHRRALWRKSKKERNTKKRQGAAAVALRNI